MAMTLQAILNRTPANRQDPKNFIQIYKLKNGKKGGHPFVRAIIGSVRPHAPRYVAEITQYGRFVMVACSCEDFMYTWEYALAQKGAAAIEYSNGEPPGVRNPREVAGACKHLYVLGQKLFMLQQ
jgi:hypothetical protein